MGWDAACTVQVEGIADQPAGVDLDRIKASYFARFPDGRDRAGHSAIAYWRVRPNWIRYSDFNVDPPMIIEWNADDIAAWNDAW
jgi:hypothetical protein